MTRLTKQKKRERIEEGKRIQRETEGERALRIAFRKAQAEPGWYVMMVNEDGRCGHAEGFGMPMRREAASLICGALRSEQSRESQRDGWGYAPRKDLAMPAEITNNPDACPVNGLLAQRPLLRDIKNEREGTALPPTKHYRSHKVWIGGVLVYESDDKC